MSEGYKFDYYYGAESDQFSFVRIPKLLLNDPKFEKLTYGAILTYGILLDRMGLSIKNGWHDEDNRVFIRFKVEDLSEILGKSDDTVSGYLKELEEIGLVERTRKGMGRGKVTYVKNFISSDLKDGNFISRMNSGNDSSKSMSEDAEDMSDIENVDDSIALEASIYNISRENSGNVSRENTGNILRENSVNISQENSGQNNTELINNYANNIHVSNPSNQILSITCETPVYGCDVDTDSDYDAYIAIIKENIDYETFISRKEYQFDYEEINELVELMAEVMVCKSKTIWIASSEYPLSLVKSKLMKIRYDHIEYVLTCLKNTPSKIYNIKKYLLAALFNAPSTIENYYKAEVNHDLYGFN